jgi:hypothetical protein
VRQRTDPCEPARQGWTYTQDETARKQMKGQPDNTPQKCVPDHLCPRRTRREPAGVGIHRRPARRGVSNLPPVQVAVHADSVGGRTQLLSQLKRRDRRTEAEIKEWCWRKARRTGSPAVERRRACCMLLHSSCCNVHAAYRQNTACVNDDAVARRGDAGTFAVRRTGSSLPAQAGRSRGFTACCSRTQLSEAVGRNNRRCRVVVPSVVVCVWVCLRLCGATAGLPGNDKMNDHAWHTLFPNWESFTYSH